MTTSSTLPSEASTCLLPGKEVRIAVHDFSFAWCGVPMENLQPSSTRTKLRGTKADYERYLRIAETLQKKHGYRDFVQAAKIAEEILEPGLSGELPRVVPPPPPPPPSAPGTSSSSSSSSSSSAAVSASGAGKKKLTKKSAKTSEKQAVAGAAKAMKTKKKEEKMQRKLVALKPAASKSSTAVKKGPVKARPAVAAAPAAVPAAALASVGVGKKRKRQEDEGEGMALPAVPQAAAVAKRGLLPPAKRAKISIGDDNGAASSSSSSFLSSSSSSSSSGGSHGPTPEGLLAIAKDASLSFPAVLAKIDSAFPREQAAAALFALRSAVSVLSQRETTSRESWLGEAQQFKEKAFDTINADVEALPSGMGSAGLLQRALFSKALAWLQEREAAINKKASGSSAAGSNSSAAIGSNRSSMKKKRVISREHSP